MNAPIPSRKKSRQIPLFAHPDGLVVDLFAGGGGASTGIEAAIGRPVDIAVNHDPTALAVHCANHPQTRHLTTDVWDVDPVEATGGRPVALLWCSPDCKHFSNAKGDVPRSKRIRSLAWVAIRWAKAVRPAVIMLENVREFQGWGPLGPDGKPIKARKGETFRKWLGMLRGLGYVVEYRVLDSADYGAPTRRKRLFLVARRDGQPIAWPEATHGAARAPFHTAAECIDWSLPCPSIFDRQKPLAEKTMWRIAQGLKRFVFENPRPFILKVNHGKWEPRHESADGPLSTVTATQRGHALVIPTLQQSGYGERKGQAARVLDLHQPLGTAVDGQKHALVAAFLVKHFGDPLRESGGGVVVGSELHEPIGTVTARDHHSLAAVALAKFRGTAENQPPATSASEPLPTISAGGIHSAQVCAFLSTYYGSDGTGGQRVDHPSRTITTKARLGIVLVEGVAYQVVDIGFRMLEPHELLRAQFGRFADGYDMRAAKSKRDKIRLIGNSVCPEMAEALVRANAPEHLARAA